MADNRPYYKELGIVNPAEVADDRRIDKHEAEFKKTQKSGAIPVMWTDEYNRVWTWLMRTFTGMEIMPPPLYVDHRKAVTAKRDGGITILGASMDWLFSSLDDYSIVPIDYRCHVYHHGMLKTLGANFHSQVPIRALITFVRHDLLHELLHYFTFYNMWKQGTDWDYQERKALEKITHFIREEMGNFDDERANEAKTLQYLWEMETFYSRRINGTIYGGPYDLFLRGRDKVWKAMTLAYEFMMLQYKLEFDRSIDFAKTLEYHGAVVKAIRKMGREENKRFKLLD